MPIRAELRGISGERIRFLDDPAGGSFDAAGDFDELLPMVAPQRTDVIYRVLGSVDPDGTLELNPSRMEDLLADIEAMKPLASSPRAERGLERLRVLAEHCQAHPNERLVFIGE